MGTISLKYGKTSLSFNLKKENYEILLPSKTEPVPDPEMLLSTAIDNPVGVPALDQIFSSDDQILIVVSDITRHTGANIFLPILLQKLNKTGIEDSQISILFAPGIHRKLTDLEKKTIAGETVAQRIKMYDHNPDDSDQMKYIGETLRGTPIIINSEALNADGLILTGSIVFHYLAGFGGGGKALLPGISSRESCIAFHKLVLKSEDYGKRPISFSGHLENNMLQEEIAETANKLSPDFLLNTVTDSSGKIIFAVAGELREAHKRGCSYFMRQYGIHIKEKADLVIVSCGGYPKDLNFIQAHKSIDLAFRAVREGGVMIVLAECPDGFGNSTFLNWFRFTDNKSFLQNLHSKFEINGQTAFSTFMKARMVRIILISSLKDEDVTKMSMIPASNIEKALTISNDLLCENHSVCIIPEGSNTLPIYEN